jgi:hypothetical protein
MIAGAMYAAFFTNSRRDALCFDFSLATWPSTHKDLTTISNLATTTPSHDYRFLDSDHEQIQVSQPAHHDGNIIQCSTLFHIESLREQPRDLNHVGNLVTLVPDKARSFIELMNLVEFRVEQQQLTINPAQYKMIPPLDQSCRWILTSGLNFHAGRPRPDVMMVFHQASTLRVDPPKEHFI